MTEPLKNLEVVEAILAKTEAYAAGGPDCGIECWQLVAKRGLPEGFTTDWVDKILAEAKEARRAYDKQEAEKLAEQLKNAKPEPKPLSLMDRIKQAIEKPVFISTSNAPNEQKALTKPVEVLPPLPSPLAVGCLNNLLQDMNNRHAVIDNLGGKAVIASYELTPEGKYRWVFQTKESFQLIYSNRKVVWEDRSMFLADWWLGHRHRAQHRTVVFMPSGDKVVYGCLNLWQGWGIEAKEGDWSLFRSHIYDVLAAGKKEFGDYIIKWVAWAIQNPHKQAEAALVLIGAKGAGKGTFVRCLEKIFGAHSFQVTSREEVIGKFNGHLQDCILFVADEAYWGGDKRCVGRLQGMITEPRIPIERKGIDLIQVPNMLHIVMLAEPGWVIPAGAHERRYAALAVSKAKLFNTEYFVALNKEMKEGGAAAMFYDLQRMELGEWHPRYIPKAMLQNPELQKQQTLTLPPIDQWYVGLLHNAMVPRAFANKPSTAYTKYLLADARESNVRLRELTEVGLKLYVTDEERIGAVCTKFRNSIANGWTLPPLEVARAAWEEKYGPMVWDNPVKHWQIPPDAAEAKEIRLNDILGRQA